MLILRFRHENCNVVSKIKINLANEGKYDNHIKILSESNTRREYMTVLLSCINFLALILEITMARSSRIELEFKNESHWKSVENDQRFLSLLEVTYHGVWQKAIVESCVLSNGRAIVTIMFDSGATVYVSKFVSLCNLFIITL